MGDPWSMGGRAPRREVQSDGSVIFHVDFPDGEDRGDADVPLVGNFRFGKFGQRDFDNYYFGGQDQHGHEFEMRCKTDKRIGPLVATLVADYRTPYRYAADFLRNAVYQQLLTDYAMLDEAPLAVADIVADLESEKQATASLERMRLKQKAIQAINETLESSLRAKDWQIFNEELERAQQTANRWADPWKSELQVIIDGFTRYND